MKSSKPQVLDHICESMNQDSFSHTDLYCKQKCKYTFTVSLNGNKDDTVKFGFVKRTLADGSLAPSNFYCAGSDSNPHRYFSQTAMLDIYQAISEYCLQNLNDEFLNGFCEKYLNITEDITKQIQANHYAMDQTIRLQGKEYQLTLCTYAPDIFEIDDIDYVTLHGDSDLSATSLADFASNIANIDAIAKEAEYDKSLLIDFYKKNNLDDLVDTKIRASYKG